MASSSSVPFSATAFAAAAAAAAPPSLLSSDVRLSPDLPTQLAAVSAEREALVAAREAFTGVSARVTAEALVPLGSTQAALVAGTIVHTGEVLCPLGCGYLAWRTTAQASALVDARLAALARREERLRMAVLACARMEDLVREGAASRMRELLRTLVRDGDDPHVAEVQVEGGTFSYITETEEEAQAHSAAAVAAEAQAAAAAAAAATLDRPEPAMQSARIASVVAALLQRAEEGGEEWGEEEAAGATDALPGLSAARRGGQPQETGPSSALAAAPRTSPAKSVRFAPDVGEGRAGLPSAAPQLARPTRPFSDVEPLNIDDAARQPPKAMPMPVPQVGDSGTVAFSGQVVERRPTAPMAAQGGGGAPPALSRFRARMAGKGGPI